MSGGLRCCRTSGRHPKSEGTRNQPRSTPPHIKAGVSGAAARDLPNRGTPPSSDQLQQYDAVQLFVTRTQTVRADFALTDENAAAVVDICRRLDGLPLAIELAAACSKLFSPQLLLARLDRRLALLTGGPEDVPARQQALRATIDWSYDLLEPLEQTLFARLAVFVGGCTIEAAEAVVALDVHTFEYASVLDGLELLTNQHLLYQVQSHAVQPRFGMLETICEYALEQLSASGELPTIRRKHAEFFLTFAETAAAALEGAEQSMWLSQLQQEHDNLRAALGWAVEQQESSIGLRSDGATAFLVHVRGYLTEGRERLAQILALAHGECQRSCKGARLCGVPRPLSR